MFVTNCDKDLTELLETVQNECRIAIEWHDGMIVNLDRFQWMIKCNMLVVILPKSKRKRNIYFQIQIIRTLIYFMAF